MYRYKAVVPTTLRCNKTDIGESIEEKVTRIIVNKEPIKDGAQTIFTDREDGVLPEYNVKTDRFELACESMDIVHRGKEVRGVKTHNKEESNDSTESTGSTGDE